MTEKQFIALAKDILKNLEGKEGYAKFKEIFDNFEINYLEMLNCKENFLAELKAFIETKQG